MGFINGLTTTFGIFFACLVIYLGFIILKYGIRFVKFLFPAIIGFIFKHWIWTCIIGVILIIGIIFIMGFGGYDETE